MRMLIKGVDISRYVQSFSKNNIASVVQFLEIFKWDKEAEDWLREYLATTPAAPPPADDLDEYNKPQIIGPGIVLGTHDCGGEILRFNIRGCHTAATGRVAYEECTKCTYYKEVFREVEGGE